MRGFFCHLLESRFREIQAGKTAIPARASSIAAERLLALPFW
jgi:hypothetical protein